MAGGHANDLATAVLLAADRPILIAPAMNPIMWTHRATSRNIAQLVADGVRLVGPNKGEMAEPGEAGLGRMAEPLEIVAAAGALIEEFLGGIAGRPLARKRIVITSVTSLTLGFEIILSSFFLSILGLRVRRLKGTAP